MILNNNIVRALAKKDVSKFNFQKYLESKKLSRDKVVQVSYDLQSGSYLKNYFKDIKKDKKLINLYSSIIKKKFGKINSILDFGCGELTRTIQLKKKLSQNIKFFANDTSFNRLYLGINFFKKKKNLELFLSDYFKLPFKDSSIDIVITCHSLEPNNKFKNKLIKELLRVSRLGAIFLEPSYELDDKKVRSRMKYYDYIRGIPKVLKKFKNISVEVMANPFPINPENTSAFYIIKNKKIRNKKLKSEFFKNGSFLKFFNSFWYSKNELCAYPIINNISIFNKRFKIFLPKL